MVVQSVEGGNGAGESDVLSVIRADGTADPELDPRLPTERLRELVSAMLRARVVDERLAAWGEAGRIGFLPRAAGREAAVVGAAAALDGGDWIFPTPQDWAVALFRGTSTVDFVHRVFGDAHDALKGHDMPGGLSARERRIASVSAPAATHLPHAVGVAWSARREGEPLVTAALFDAPEIDAADFHTGLNFAGVMKAPTVFLCRVRRGEESAAEHAVAYGLERARCDGSDLLAVVRTVGEAVERARRGEGPTVVDLVLGGDDEALEKARAHAAHVGAFDDEAERSVREATEQELASALDAASRAGDPQPGSIFEHVFHTLPPHLDAQRDELLDSPRPPAQRRG